MKEKTVYLVWLEDKWCKWTFDTKEEANAYIDEHQLWDWHVESITHISNYGRAKDDD